MPTFSLQQVVRVGTRGENILHILLLSEMFSEGMVDIEPGISDHKLISFTSTMYVNNVRRPREKCQVRDYVKADDASIIDHLNLHLNIVHGDVELSWQKFRDTVTYCFERFISLKVVKKPRSNPWINRDIIQTNRKLKRTKKKHKAESLCVK